MALAGCGSGRVWVDGAIALGQFYWISTASAKGDGSTISRVVYSSLLWRPHPDAGHGQFSPSTGAGNDYDRASCAVEVGEARGGRDESCSAGLGSERRVGKCGKFSMDWGHGGVGTAECGFGDDIEGKLTRLRVTPPR